MNAVESFYLLQELSENTTTMFECNVFRTQWVGEHDGSVFSYGQDDDSYDPFEIRLANPITEDDDEETNTLDVPYNSQSIEDLSGGEANLLAKTSLFDASTISGRVGNIQGHHDFFYYNRISEGAAQHAVYQLDRNYVDIEVPTWGAKNSGMSRVNSLCFWLVSLRKITNLWQTKGDLPSLCKASLPVRNAILNRRAFLARLTKLVTIGFGVILLLCFTA